MNTTYADAQMFRYTDNRGNTISITRTPRKDGNWNISRRVTGRDGYYKPALSFDTIESNDFVCDMWPQATAK